MTLGSSTVAFGPPTRPCWTVATAVPSLFRPADHEDDVADVRREPVDVLLEQGLLLDPGLERAVRAARLLALPHAPRGRGAVSAAQQHDAVRDGHGRRAGARLGERERVDGRPGAQGAVVGEREAARRGGRACRPRPRPPMHVQRVADGDGRRVGAGLGQGRDRRTRSSMLPTPDECAMYVSVVGLRAVGAADEEEGVADHRGACRRSGPRAGRPRTGRGATAASRRPGPGRAGSRSRAGRSSTGDQASSADVDRLLDREVVGAVRDVAEHDDDHARTRTAPWRWPSSSRRRRTGRRRRAAGRSRAAGAGRAVWAIASAPDLERAGHVRVDRADEGVVAGRAGPATL